MIELVSIALAVWRISSILVREEGPLDIFVRLRAFVGVKYDEYSQPYGGNMFARLLTCIFCTSVWTGTAAAILYILFPEYTFYLSLPFSFSAVAIIVDKLIIGDK